MADTEVKYNVQCSVCGDVYTPVKGSGAWWKAKQKEARGYLDCAQVSGKECGSIGANSDQKHSAIGEESRRNSFSFVPYAIITACDLKYIVCRNKIKYI